MTISLHVHGARAYGNAQQIGVDGEPQKVENGDLRAEDGKAGDVVSFILSLPSSSTFLAQPGYHDIMFSYG
jgi:hypothetical protein